MSKNVKSSCIASAIRIPRCYRYTMIMIGPNSKNSRSRCELTYFTSTLLRIFNAASKFTRDIPERKNSRDNNLLLNVKVSERITLARLSAQMLRARNAIRRRRNAAFKIKSMPESCKPTLIRLDLDDELTCTASSTDGTLLVGGTSYSTVIWWTIQLLNDPSSHNSYKCRTHRSGSITAVAVNESKTLVICAGFDFSIVLICIPASLLLARFRGHSDYIKALCFLSNAYFASGGNDCTVRFWEISTDQQLKILPNDSGRVTCLQPSGPNLIVGADDGTVRVWEFDSFAISLKLYRTQGPPITAISGIIHDKYIFIGCINGNIALLDLNTRTKLELKTIFKSRIVNLFIQENEVCSCLVAGGSNQIALMYDWKATIDRLERNYPNVKMFVESYEVNNDYRLMRKARTLIGCSACVDGKYVLLTVV